MSKEARGDTISCSRVISRSFASTWRLASASAALASLTSCKSPVTSLRGRQGEQ